LLELRRMRRSSHLESHGNWSAATPLPEAPSEKILMLFIRNATHFNLLQRWILHSFSIDRSIYQSFSVYPSFLSRSSLCTRGWGGDMGG
jgi:hypothetical protein